MSAFCSNFAANLGKKGGKACLLEGLDGFNTYKI